MGIVHIWGIYKISFFFALKDSVQQRTYGEDSMRCFFFEKRLGSDMSVTMIFNVMVKVEFKVFMNIRYYMIKVKDIFLIINPFIFYSKFYVPIHA